MDKQFNINTVYSHNIEPFDREKYDYQRELTGRLDAYDSDFDQ